MPFVLKLSEIFEQLQGATIAIFCSSELLVLRVLPKLFDAKSRDLTAYQADKISKFLCPPKFYVMIKFSKDTPPLYF